MRLAPRAVSKSFALALGILSSSGCAGHVGLRKGYVECNSTDTCRAQTQAREHAFAQLVANEPLAARASVEVVTRVVLVDRQKQAVYALDPTFVELDLRTGQERRRWDNVTGDVLTRAGQWLVAFYDDVKDVRFHFINPAKPNEKPSVCAPHLPKPAEAETAYLHPFDRAGQPYFYWHSAYHYVGGVPPSKEIEKRQMKADACGIMRLDAVTCAAQSVSFDDFLWEPPEGRRARAGDDKFCYYLSPQLDFPAAAASAPQAASGYGSFAPATQAPMLTVRSEQEKSSGCEQLTRLTLEARDEGSKVLWTHVLAPVSVLCGPP